MGSLLRTATRTINCRKELLLLDAVYRLLEGIHT
jgi:hypothetical protein